MPQAAPSAMLAGVPCIVKVTAETQAHKIRAERYAAYIELIGGAPGSATRQLAAVAHRAQTQSQIGQDLFVLLETNFKRGGYFVEFGAADGMFLSNSYLLETEFAWQGILAEPAKTWHARLREARTSKIDHRCVWSKSGETLEFNETSDAEYSTVASLNDNDQHSLRRAGGISYKVPTISLNDLLREHDAPALPDYLSIDTEGSEFDILTALDFDRYRFEKSTLGYAEFCFCKPFRAEWNFGTFSKTLLCWRMVGAPGIKPGTPAV